MEQTLVGCDRLAISSLKVFLPRNEDPGSQQHHDLGKAVGSKSPRGQWRGGVWNCTHMGQKEQDSVIGSKLLQNEVPTNEKEKRNLLEKCRQHWRQTNYLKILLLSVTSHIYIQSLYSILLNLAVFSNHNFSSVFHFQTLESLFNTWGLKDYTDPLQWKPG